MCWICIPHLICIHLHVTECRNISQVNVKCHVYFRVEVHRSIGTFYSKSNYTVHRVQFTILEVTPQMLHLKADNQTTRSVSLFPTWHHKCLRKHFAFTQIKTINFDSLSNCCFYRHAILFVPCFSHLFCLIIASSFLPVSILCLKYHPFPHLYISFSCWLLFFSCCGG